MALGCFLWIAGICFLLFNGSVGLPAVRGYGYPYKADSRNIGDDVEDEAIMSHDWQAPHGQPSGDAYASYDRPSAPWQPISVATEPSAPAVESLVNSESRDWILRNPNSPLLFPLSHKPSNPAGPQPGPNTGSSAHGGGSQNVPHLVYEDVFQYPSENAEQSPRDDGVSNTAGGPGQAGYMSTGSSEYYSEPSYQRYPSNAGAQQVASSAKGSSSPAKMSYQSQNPVASQEEEVSSRRHNRHRPRPHPRPTPEPIYIIQSRDGFKRVRTVSSKSKYSPRFFSRQDERSEPAKRQAAAPVGVKNPQSSRMHG